MFPRSRVDKQGPIDLLLHFTYLVLPERMPLVQSRCLSQWPLAESQPFGESHATSRKTALFKESDEPWTHAASAVLPMLVIHSSPLTGE